MSTPPSQQNDFLAARAESCRLLGLNPDDLSPHEMIRCDLLTVLRLWLDGSQSALLSGGTADPVKILAVAEVLGKLVPEPEHRSRGESPQEHMWRTYKQMRDRGALHGEGLDGLKLENERLRAKIAELEAAAAPAPGEPFDDIPVVVERMPAPAGNVVPMSRPPAASAPAPAAPQYDYNKEQGWKDYIEPTGEIRSTPRGPGRYWGPV
jgi:hypothetical protein